MTLVPAGFKRPSISSVIASACLAKTKGKRSAAVEEAGGDLGRDWEAGTEIVDVCFRVVGGILLDCTVGGPEIQEEGCTERWTMRGSLGD